MEVPSVITIKSATEKAFNFIIALAIEIMDGHGLSNKSMLAYNYLPVSIVWQPFKMYLECLTNYTQVIHK